MRARRLRRLGQIPKVAAAVSAIGTNDNAMLTSHGPLTNTAIIASNATAASTAAGPDAIVVDVADAVVAKELLPPSVSVVPTTSVASAAVHAPPFVLQPPPQLHFDAQKNKMPDSPTDRHGGSGLAGDDDDNESVPDGTQHKQKQQRLMDDPRAHHLAGDGLTAFAGQAASTVANVDAEAAVGMMNNNVTTPVAVTTEDGECEMRAAILC